MTNPEKKVIFIFQERMAGWLMFNGSHKIAEKPDAKSKNQSKIYIFEDTQKNRELMRLYSRAPH